MFKARLNVETAEREVSNSQIAANRIDWSRLLSRSSPAILETFQLSAFALGKDSKTNY